MKKNPGNLLDSQDFNPKAVAKRILIATADPAMPVLFPYTVGERTKVVPVNRPAAITMLQKEAKEKKMEHSAQAMEVNRWLHIICGIEIPVAG